MTDERDDMADREVLDRAHDTLDILADIVGDRLDLIRMGVYDESRHGTLLEVLEEIERLVME